MHKRRPGVERSGTAFPPHHCLGGRDVARSGRLSVLSRPRNVASSIGCWPVMSRVDWADACSHPMQSSSIDPCSERHQHLLAQTTGVASSGLNVSNRSSIPSSMWALHKDDLGRLRCLREEPGEYGRVPGQVAHGSLSRRRLPGCGLHSPFRSRDLPGGSVVAKAGVRRRGSWPFGRRTPHRSGCPDPAARQVA